MDAVTWCAAPGTRHEPERGRLCDNHLQALSGWLRDVEREIEWVDVAPASRNPLAAGGGSSGTPAFERAAARIEAMVLTDTRRGLGNGEARGMEREAGRLRPAYEVLHRYANLVRRGRGIQGPTAQVVVGRRRGVIGPLCARLATTCLHPSCQGMRDTIEVPTSPSLHDERVMLTRHLDWCADRPWIGGMFREVGDLRTALQRINGTSDEKPLPGRCPWTTDDGECGGRLWPVRPEHTSGANVPTAPELVECGDNPNHVWKGRDLARLALTVGRQTRPA